MIISCISDIKVVSKSVKVAQNGKTYFNLGVAAPDGDLGMLGCTADVYNMAIEGKTYSCHFNINTAYLRKDYNCSINIDSLKESFLDSDKKSTKGA